MSDSTYKPVSIGEWIVTYILMAIPLVNVIMLFVWGFGSNTAVSKANWAKAFLIMMLIGIGLQMLLFFAFGFSFLAVMAQQQQAMGK